MPVTRITDACDGRLADYRNVPDPELLRARHVFVAEGRLVVRRLLTACRLPARSIMVTEPALASIEDAIAERPDLPVYLVPQAVMDGVTGFNLHRGCLAVGERLPLPHWADLTAGACRIVALERLGNADNVGAVFRSAAAFGFDAVLIGPACADPLYRKAIRTSMGAALTVPFARADPWPNVLRTLGRAGWMVTAMVTAPDAPPLRDVACLAGARRVAVLIGHEGEGLSPEAVAACTHRARIAMAGTVDSLNAAAAAAIGFYELAPIRREDAGRPGPVLSEARSAESKES